jgi:hypothetical protein
MSKYRKEVTMMFKIMNYRVRFSRLQDSDVTYCYVDRDDEGFSCGQAKKHPSDGYCKVEGKKVALTHALNAEPESDAYVPKSDRVAIWRAFWEWIRSWSASNGVRYEGRGV